MQKKEVALLAAQSKTELLTSDLQTKVKGTVSQYIVYHMSTRTCILSWIVGFHLFVRCTDIHIHVHVYTCITGFLFPVNITMYMYL